MKTKLQSNEINNVDILIIGAGPVGLMCAYLANLCGLSFSIIDKSDGPLKVGRADALNARTLQLLEIVNLFDELYPLGKTCNTSSIWASGAFVSRQSTWWDELEGCKHKHFLMLGQAYVEKLLNEKLKLFSNDVIRSVEIKNIELNENGCLSTLSNDLKIQSKFIIGADGSRSFVRDYFKICFEITKPQIIWAVVDGIIQTDFPKVPEIIVFQAETSDVAWIPREGEIDRFYIRMDKQDFTFEEVMQKINKAIAPHELTFNEIIWYSKFAVRESVAEKFFVHDRVFLAGDACHIHSVNGGQGLNTGLADAFNLIWKINLVLKGHKPIQLLQTYERERKPVAISVIESSGKLVRSTKFSENGTHAKDYIKNVKKYSGNITGMGIRYDNDDGLVNSRIYDFDLFNGESKMTDSKVVRLYSLLDYSKFSLIVFGNYLQELKVPDFVQVIKISLKKCEWQYWTENSPYQDQIILVRPDSYIASVSDFSNFDPQYILNI